MPMSDITIVPATAERFDDALEVIGSGCTCQYFRMSSGEYSRASQDDRLEALSAQLAGTPAPGLLAYEGDLPVGWVAFAPRLDYGRLVRSRTIPWVVEDDPAWSIVCFKVRTGHRRGGITKRLLAGVVDYAREMGAPALEGYPIDPGDKRVSTAFLYVGTVKTFEEAGFHKVTETDSKSAGLTRWLMRMELS